MNRTLLFIGLSGRMGTGKDYMAGVIKAMLPSQRRCLHIALADQLKVDAMVKDNLSFESVFDEKTAESRRALQIRGTEEGRNKFGENIWTDTLTQWMRIFAEQRGVDTFICTDVRFPNEVEWARSLPTLPGFSNMHVELVRLEASERNRDRRLVEAGGDEDHAAQLASHSSETALDHAPATVWDAVIDNNPGSYECLAAIADVARRCQTASETTVVMLDATDQSDDHARRVTQAAFRLGNRHQIVFWCDDRVAGVLRLAKSGLHHCPVIVAGNITSALDQLMEAHRASGYGFISPHPGHVMRASLMGLKAMQLEDTESEQSLTTLL